MKQNYYEILGVQPTASQKEIDSAYRKLARQYHPDLHQSNPLADLAEEKMKEINEAYSVLKDISKRDKYDATLNHRSRSTERYSEPAGGYAYETGESYSRESHGSELDSIIEQALIAYQTHNYDLSLHYLDQIIVQKPDIAEIRNLRGLVLSELYRYNEALDEYSTAMRLDPDEYIWYYNRAGTYLKMKRYELAINDLKTADSLKPNDPKIMIAFMIAYTNSGQHMRAKNYEMRARRMDPNNPVFMQFDNFQNQRNARREEYNNVNNVGCCPNCCDCLCTAAWCDLCCIPGGCCIFSGW